MSEIYQVQKKYYGLDTKWGDIEQWMEDSERYSHRSRRNASVSDEDERMSVGSRGSLRGNYNSDLGLPGCGANSKAQPAAQNGSRPSLLTCDALTPRSYRQPSEYSCYLGSGSRASSRTSSARASPVVEERPEKDFNDKGARTASSLSAATLASLGGTSSRRGSGDTSISVDTEASIREIKDSLAEVEEKYKKAMVSNAQLDNEKTNFMYQVDTLKDVLLEIEEQLAETHRQYEEKSKEFEREKHSHQILQTQYNELKESLAQRDELLTRHGIVLSSDLSPNGGILDGPLHEALVESSTKVPDNSAPVSKTGDGPLDIRLKKLVEERELFLEQIKRLKAQLEGKPKNSRMESPECNEEVLENGTDVHVLDLQRDANRQISDLKFKLAKSEQEITALEQNVIRLEAQVTRYRSAADNAEKVEDELKAEKRKLQRELRTSLDKIEELTVSNNHLSKRLEKMKANRSALLSQQ